MARSWARPLPPAFAMVIVVVLLLSMNPGMGGGPSAVPPLSNGPGRSGGSAGELSTLPTASPAASAVTLSERAVVASEAARPSTATPSSDVIETPPPAIPPTQPTTYVIASKLNCPNACTPSMNVTAPSGPWALILLNFTGSVAPSVYDSSYHATVNGVPVFFGTTPELYTWTVLKDLTEYSALFEGTAQFQFVLGQATIGGHFILNVSLSFYPVPTGAAPPRVPNQIVPLWPFTGLSSSRTLASANASVPYDVQNATLELFSYGFSNGAYDEFWYSGSGGYAAYRAVDVTVDGSPLATVQPFEYINTGGLDLYLWDPVTGAYTANDLPYEVDVTAALGLLEGPHAFNATVVGREAASTWFVGGSLLLYTNASYTGASLISEPLPSVTYTNGTSTTRGIPPPETVTRSYTYASDLSSPNGTQLVESWTNETFASSFPTGPNPNETGAIVNAATRFQEISLAPWGVSWRNDSSSPSVAFESGSVFLQSSSTNGGYPYYGNITQTMYWLDQNWNLTHVDTEVPAHGPRMVLASYSNDNVTANGMYSGEEKLISPAAAELLSISTFWSNTTKSYASFEVSGSLTASYSHAVTAQLTPADLSTNLAQVLSNAVHYSDSADLSESHPTSDVGQANTFSIRAFGFGGPFTFSWSGLPSGCSPSPAQLTLVCRASSPKPFVVSVVALGAFGQSTPATTVTWTVDPDPTLSVTVKPAEIDLGRSTNLTLSASGGLAPFKCTWTANGVPVGPGNPCPKSFAYDPSSAGSINVSVNLTDALGFLVSNWSFLIVEPAPTATLEFANPSSSAIPRIAIGDTLV
ncbi:MAG TPA: peptide-N4-asparagine amidase, partial [Thermoplasmata archaeon]|nr:peptide-N4-asparagine amidase [Thermoplasmata archaeon]